MVDSSINGRIAQRVRSLRVDRGLSLESLASKCAVSRSMLSLIERGESSPTAVILEKIAGGLDVSLASLFEDAAAAPNPLSQADERQVWRDPESGYLRRTISPPAFASPFQIVEVELPPGARVAYENAARDAVLHQQIWMREGTLEFTLGSQHYRLTSGDCLAMQLDAPTMFRNPTRKPARYVVVVSTERSRGNR
jgi:transcriptional regulator with XRE-family HTH domain